LESQGRDFKKVTILTTSNKNVATGSTTFSNGGNNSHDEKTRTLENSR